MPINGHKNPPTEVGTTNEEGKITNVGQASSL